MAAFCLSLLRLLVVANLIADTRNSIGTFHFLYTCPTLSSDRNTDKGWGYFIPPPDSLIKIAVYYEIHRKQTTNSG